MRVVVDANVWASGMILPGSVPGRVLDAVRTGRAEAVASWALAEEIAEVVRHPRIRKYGVTESDVRDVMILLGPLLPDVEVEVEIRDPDDAPVVAAALAGGARAVVTGDPDLLEDEDRRAWLEERRVLVLSPAGFLRWLEREAPR